VRRKRGNRKLECSGCGRKFAGAYDSNERPVRDLPWSEFRRTVRIEVYRVKCPDRGVKVEKVPLLPSKAPFIVMDPKSWTQKWPFLRWSAALKMKESQCHERERVTHPA
jgi:transposase